MKPLGEKLIFFVLRYSLPILFFIALFSCLALFFIPKIPLDNDVESFWDKQSENYLAFQDWQDEFGNDRFIIVAFADKDIFTKENLELISYLSERFEALTYVAKVTSLTTVNDIVGDENNFTVEPLIGQMTLDAEALSRIKKQALGNPLFLQNLISEDATTAAIVVQLESRKIIGDNAANEVMLAIQKILKNEVPQHRRYYISGPAAMQSYYTKYVQQDLKIFLPLIFLVVTIVVFFSFRSAAGVLLPLAVIVTTLLWSMFFLYSRGYAINSITTIVPVVVLAIALADSVHFVEKCRSRKTRNDATALHTEKFLTETMAQLGLPCFMTTLTTVIGFFSLLVSPVGPVRELGLVAGFGILLAFIITFTLLPAFVKQFNLFKPTQNATGFKSSSSAVSKKPCFFWGKFDIFIRSLGRFNEKFKLPVLIVTMGVVAISLWGVTRIKVETSVLEFFKKDSPLRESTSFIEERLSGIHFLEVSLKADSIDYFRYPEALRDIEELQHFLVRIPQVDKVTAVTDYIKEINQSFHNEDKKFYSIPASKRLVSQYLLLYGAADLRDYIDSQWQWATVQVRLKEHSTTGLGQVINQIRQYLDKNFSQLSQAKVLGIPILEVESNEATLRGQIQSLSLAMVLIFAMMFVLFRTVSVGLVSIVPNALPILINFGLMGIAGIRLDSATSMISAIGIGIIVDDTIHFLHQFGKEIKKDNDYVQAMYRTLALKGRPIVFTSIILFFGLGVLIFSKFMPTLYFGVLSATLMFTAIIGDLIVLPCLLLFFRPKFH